MAALETKLNFWNQVEQGPSTGQEATIIAGKRFDRFKGFSLVLLGAVLWGISGTAAQVLFQRNGFSPGWLVAMRMSLSGLLLLVGTTVRFGPTPVFAIWRDKKDAARLVLFGIGLLGVQYTYFASIQAGNAATATFLQYLGPIFITVYTVFRRHRLPGAWEVGAVLFALFGVALLVTNGDWHGLSVAPAAVVWGLLSALAIAVYTVYSTSLLQKYGAAVITGWGMLIGGIGINFRTPLWDFSGVSTIGTWWLVSFVVIFGTLIAFYVYISSLKYISAAEASLLASGEPLSAAFVAMAFLHVQMSVSALVGGLFILVTVTMLAFKGAQHEG